MAKTDSKNIISVRMLLIESYANLGMAHAALNQGAVNYGPLQYMIRSKLRRGLSDESMSMRPLADDEKLKLRLPQACSYCGITKNLSVDHLIPTARGGGNTGDNFVWACRSCNSSKGSKDMLSWWFTKQPAFPPILLLRRYLKIAWQLAEEAGILDEHAEHITDFPIRLDTIPTKYPKPSQLCLWALPIE